MANLIRRVRTPGGARYFGLPIGAIITADARLAAKERHGGKSAPKGATSVRVASGTPFSGQKPVNTKANADKAVKATDAVKALLAKNGTAPGGPKKVRLNGAEHDFPEGTQVSRSKQFPNRIAYAMTPDGRVFRMADEHIDEPQGEPKAALAEAFKAGGNDVLGTPVDIDADNYDPNTDPNEADFVDVANLPEGETLSNTSGMKTFTKTGENEWSDSKGFKIDDAKMQKLVDLGSFGQGGTEIPDTVDEDTNLADLLGDEADLEDFQEYLDGLPNGQKALSELGESYTKNENGDDDTWTEDTTGETVTNQDLAELAPLITLEKSPVVTEEEVEAAETDGKGSKTPSADADEPSDPDADDDPEASTAAATKAAAEVEANEPDVAMTEQELDALEEGTEVQTSFGESWRKNAEGRWDLITDDEDDSDLTDSDSAALAEDGVDPVSVLTPADLDPSSDEDNADESSNEDDAEPAAEPEAPADEPAEDENSVEALKKKWDDAKEAWDKAKADLAEAKKSGDQDAIDEAQGNHTDALKAHSQAKIAHDKAVRDKANEGKSDLQVAQEEYDKSVQEYNKAQAFKSGNAVNAKYEMEQKEKALNEAKAASGIKHTGKPKVTKVSEKPGEQIFDVATPDGKIGQLRRTAKTNYTPTKGNTAQFHKDKIEWDSKAEGSDKWENYYNREDAIAALVKEAQKTPEAPKPDADEPKETEAPESIADAPAEVTEQDVEDAGLDPATQAEVESLKEELDSKKPGTLAKVMTSDFEEVTIQKNDDGTWSDADSPGSTFTSEEVAQDSVGETTGDFEYEEPEDLDEDESAAIDDAEILDEDEDAAVETAVPDDAPEVTDPKKVQALRDSYAEDWMAKENLVFGTGDVTEETIENAPTGLILEGNFEGEKQKFVKLPNGLWFDGENGFTDEDLTDLLNSKGGSLQHPNEIPGFKGIANAVPEKKASKKAAEKKTYGDTLVESNKGKTFSVKDEDKYGNEKFLAEADADGNFTLSVNGVPLTKSQVAQAYHALNNHTSSHVTYGLYTLPADHPMAEKGLINQFRDTALLRYPNSKPKAAALLTLKEAGNIQDAPILHPKGKKILVGNFLDKRHNVQGPAYDFFSIDDMHDAVAILDHLDDPSIKGKMFKAALTFNLNAVGNIDPSKIIHNGKDKDLNRQKFKSYLKNVLNTSALVPTKEQYVARLDAMKAGHKVTTRQGKVYTKTEMGVWTTPDADGALSSSSLFDKHTHSLTFFSQKKSDMGSLGDNARAVTLNDDGTATLWKRNLEGKWTRVFDDSEKGDKFSFNDNSMTQLGAREVFTFTTDNEDIVAYDPDSGEPIFYDADAADAEIEAWTEEVEKVLSDDDYESETIAMSEKEVTVDEPGYLTTLAPGSDVSNSNGEVYIKDGAGNFVPESSTKKAAQFVDSAPGTRMIVLGLSGQPKWVYHKDENGVMKNTNNIHPLFGQDIVKAEQIHAASWAHSYFVGDVMTKDDLSNAPVGTRALFDDTDDGGLGSISQYVTLRKTADGKWHGSNGHTFDDDELAEVKAARFLLNSLPTPKKDSDDVEILSVEAIPNGQTVILRSPTFGTPPYVAVERVGDDFHVRSFNDSGAQGVVILNTGEANLRFFAAKSEAKSGALYAPIPAKERDAHIDNALEGDTVAFVMYGGLSVLRMRHDGQWAFDHNPDHIVPTASVKALSAEKAFYMLGHQGNIKGIHDTSDPVKSPEQLIEDHGEVTVHSEPVSKNTGMTVAQESNEEYLQATTDDPDAIPPGKYTTENGGAAYMVVFNDGTGVYVNKAGEKKNLTKAAVKKNHGSGMSKYHGSSDETKATSSDAEKAAYGKSLKKDDKDFTLEDGTYYVGDPSKANSTIYEVKDGEVSAYKPITTMKIKNNSWEKGSTYKSGDFIGWHTFANAPEGSTGRMLLTTSEPVKPEFGGKHESKVVLRRVGESGVQVEFENGGKHLFTSEEWLDTAKRREALTAPNPENPISHVNMAGYLYVDQIGEGKVAKAKPSKATIKKQAIAGQIQDKYGNSIVPEGHVGMVMFFGTGVATHDLVKHQMQINEGNTELAGLPGKTVNLEAYINDHLGGYPDGASNEEKLQIRRKAAMEVLAHVTAGLGTETPDTDAADLFEKDSMGNFKKPLPTNPAEYGDELNSYYSTPAQYSAYIKQIGDNFGGGGIIGLHHNKMSKSEKASWVSALDVGDFKQMYLLEMNAAALEGKPHGSGYLHPGYTANVETHKVKWGPAVDGEVPVLKPIEGDWSKNVAHASPEEIDNYLIKANMQNPMHLTPAEKRQWVQAHRNVDQKTVDALSVKALLRANSGAEPLSEKPVWTDDVKPGKSYNSLFDGQQYPKSWTGQQSVEYLEDHYDDSEALQKSFAAWSKEAGHGYGSPSSTPAYLQAGFLTWHFQAKEEYDYQQSLIPIYSLAPDQTVVQGIHPSYDVVDQFGNKFLFKPQEDMSPKKKYRAEIEHASNLLGQRLGRGSADSDLVEMEIDGEIKYGQMQKMLPAVADMGSVDYSTLTPEQIADLSSEHIFDWLINNDDTWSSNALLLDSGRIVGIDKGRAFAQYGNWQGLDIDAMNSMVTTVYSDLYKTLASGSHSKEDLEKAYLTARKRVQRMVKMPDSSLEPILADGIKNRDSFGVNYQIDGEQLPDTREGLMRAFFHRKAGLVEDFDKVWQDIYDRGGFGDLPEPPVQPLGEGVTSGITDPEHLALAFRSKGLSHATMVGGANLENGSAISWTEKDVEGKTLFHTEMILAPKAQSDMTTLLQSQIDPDTTLSQQAISDPFHAAALQAGKHVSKSAASGEYNDALITGMHNNWASVKKDLDAFPPEMNGDNTKAVFPSGREIPVAQIGQYRLMLEHYNREFEMVEDAFQKKTKPERHVAQYEMLSVEPEKRYSNPDGSTLMPTTQGTYIFTASDGSVKILSGTDDALPAIFAGEDGWVAGPLAKEETPLSKYKVRKNNHTHLRKSEFKDGQKHHTGGVQTEGAPGEEYEIVLPTGESIFYRNSLKTGTPLGQQGMLTARMNAESPEEAGVAMERIREALTDFGLDVDDADMTSVELTYWREMSELITDRAGHPDDGPAWKKARKDLEQYIADSGWAPANYLENLNQSLGDEGEIQFWRDFWKGYFPTEVQDLIEKDGFLPEFKHQNLDEPDLPTGRPVFYRLDYQKELERILASNVVLGHKSQNLSVHRWGPTGGLLSGEDRLRTNGFFETGMSSSDDQSKGSSHGVYLRPFNPDNTTWNVLIRPRSALTTETYAFENDHFGDPGFKSVESPSAISSAFKNWIANSNSGPETIIPWSATLLDDIDLVVLDTAQKRDFLIQEFKKRGITEIRGLSIEERFVMSSQRQAAVQKIMKLWKEGGA